MSRSTNKITYSLQFQVPGSKFQVVVVRCAPTFRIVPDSEEVAQLLIFFTMQAPTWNLERSKGYVIVFLKRLSGQ